MHVNYSGIVHLISVIVLGVSGMLKELCLHVTVDGSHGPTLAHKSSHGSLWASLAQLGPYETSLTHMG